MNLKRADDRYLGGVCGGIAKRLNINPLIVRIFWVIISIITFIIPGLIVYIILWITMQPPEE